VTAAVKLLPAIVPLAGGAAVLAWRVSETRRPVTLRKIVIPPLGMSTGLLMFLSPATRIPWSWGLTAFVAGALVLAVPLARTSRLERLPDGTVMMRRSNGFLAILLGLLALRLGLHDWVGHLLSASQTASVFFLLAFGTILRWRFGMLRTFRRLGRTGAVGVDPGRTDPLPGGASPR